MVRFACFVNRDDVRMIQAGGRLCLVQEPLPKVRREEGLRPRHLEGHVAIQNGVIGQEDECRSCPDPIHE